MGTVSQPVGGAVPVVLGLDFGGTKVAAATCTLGGQILASSALDTRPGDGAQAVLERGIAEGRALLGRLGPGHELAGVGVSTIGIPSEAGVELAPAIPGWERLGLRSLLAEAYGAPVRVGTDVKAAATAEVRWGSLAGCDPAIYLNLGTGLAVAVVVGGKVLAGARGAAGEIGYNLRRCEDVGLGVGERPILEDLVSGMGLAAAAGALTGRPTSAAEAFELAEHRPAMAGLLAELLRELSFHLVNLAIALDPVRIAVGGGMARSWEQLQAPLEQALKSGVPYPPELVRAAHPFDAALMGALAMGVELVQGEAGGWRPVGPGAAATVRSEP